MITTPMLFAVAMICVEAPATKSVSARVACGEPAYNTPDRSNQHTNYEDVAPSVDLQ